LPQLAFVSLPSPVSWRPRGSASAGLDLLSGKSVHWMSLLILGFGN
jgi:hypothetical protein